MKSHYVVSSRGNNRMKLPTVKISVIDGVAFVEQVPPGCSVEVTDYDVDPRSPERDEKGVPCSRYCVTAETLSRPAAVPEALLCQA